MSDDPWINGWDDAEEYDGDDDDRYEDDRETPTFGCACQNPLSVDTVCAACIAYLEEQQQTPERSRG
jgi:hypothetical protein